MSRIHLCPHCRTQNFASQARLRIAGRIPLTCWRCGRQIKELDGQKISLPKNKKIAHKK